MNHLRSAWAALVTAGPASGVIPDRVKYRGPVNTHVPKRVTFDPIAIKDLGKLYPDEAQKVKRMVTLLEQGMAPLEPKMRDELVGTFGVRIDEDCRLLVYPHIDGSWHIFYVGHHDYDEAERRMSAPHIQRVASIEEALSGLPLPECARDGDCLTVPGTMVGPLRKAGYDPEIVHVFGWVMPNVVGFVHQVVRVGETIVDATATQYDRSLPSLIVASQDQYVEMLRRATGVESVTIEGVRGKSAALQSGLFWRVHPPGRPFTTEDATSTTWNRTETRQGYSCFDNPWHLWVYLMTTMTIGSARGQTVIGFSGERVGEGNDGEDLVVPDGRSVISLPWDRFEGELVETPFPPSPAFGTMSRMWSMAPRSWKAFAKSYVQWEEDRVSQHIVRAWS